MSARALDRKLEYELALRQTCRAIRRARNLAAELGIEGEADDLLSMWEHAHYLWATQMGAREPRPLKGQLRFPLREP